MEKKVQGRVHKYGDDVNTDVIIPARYLNIHDMDELSLHCMEDIDPKFVEKANPGDIIVAQDNFGCGSSREHAPVVIKQRGISCVIATTFARIFYRNAINIGLAIVESPEAADAIAEGDTVTADLDNGILHDETTGKDYTIEPFPAFIQTIIENGGLVESIKNGSIR